MTVPAAPRLRRGPGDLDATGAVAAVAAGFTSLDALLADAWARIDAWEPRLGAVVSRVSDGRGAAAGTLLGVVAGVKDLVSMGAGQTKATVARRLLEAGVSVIATLSVPDATSAGGDTPQTRNPRAMDRMAGGSSGGSAAAVAAGLVHVALGTDSGGSVRIPAACCGVVGLNTTRGLVPLTGVETYTASFDAVGPLATTVADARLVLDAMAGHDPADPVSLRDPPRPEVAARPRIGVLRQVGAGPLDVEVRAAWLVALEVLACDGAALVDVDLPFFPQAPQVARAVGAAEYAGLPMPAACRAPMEAFRREVRAVLDAVDVIVLPTLPCRIPRAQRLVDQASDSERTIEVDGVSEPLVGAMTRLVNPWNLAGVPAGSVPAGRDGDGGPIGVQVVGAMWAEQQILDVMERIEAGAGGPWPTTAPPADEEG